MSSISKFFEKPFLVKMKDYFLPDNTKPILKKKSEDFEENSFAMVDPLELNENYIEKNSNNGSSKCIKDSEIIQKPKDFSTISLYENEYSDFVILEFGDAKIISREDWSEIFKRRSLHNIPHKDLYVSLQKGISFFM